MTDRARSLGIFLALGLAATFAVADQTTVFPLLRKNILDPNTTRLEAETYLVNHVAPMPDVKSVAEREKYHPRWTGVSDQEAAFRGPAGLLDSRPSIFARSPDREGAHRSQRQRAYASRYGVCSQADPLYQPGQARHDRHESRMDRLGTAGRDRLRPLSSDPDRPLRNQRAGAVLPLPGARPRHPARPAQRRSETGGDGGIVRRRMADDRLRRARSAGSSSTRRSSTSTTAWPTSRASRTIRG